MRTLRHLLTLLAFVTLATLALPAAAIKPELVERLATGDSDEKAAAISELLAEGDASASALFQSLLDGEMQFAGKQVLIIKGGAGTDAASGKSVAPLPAEREDVVVNNRLRRELTSALDAFKLTSQKREVRLAAAKALQNDADEAMLPLVSRALDQEADPEIKAMLTLLRATAQLKSADAATRLAAVKTLASSDNPSTKSLLLELLKKDGDNFVESDAQIRAEAQFSLKTLESRLSAGDRVGQVFTGISLGSILLLAALGLAITYGLMGVINMAHGELIMVGAYSTYVVQNLFRAQMPGLFDWYLAAAVPVAFAAAALVGMALERSVIRFLYGRPLETLLATWGISLILIQAARTLFGAQNVQVENPVWMSGGITVMSNIVLPYNRIVIIGFAFAVLLLVWLLLTRTRLGLFVRAVTQNRSMASCVGVPTARVDTWAFGLGSGIAGLAGCALSQIGNVGPDLGQSYIVDSFMVVVLGGVGQLAGTVYAALGLGMANKFLEALSGAVLAKIAILAFIIVFIQKRPQGLFALKGRMADS